jgi:hypothetical protein
MYHGFYEYCDVPVQLDAYSNKENISNKKVALMVCNDENIPKYDLKNLEFESYIKKMLTPKGYSFTENKDEANIVIFYEYGISDPQVYTSQRIVPVWGQTGISSSTTTTHKNSSGKPYTTTTYSPSYGKIGEKVVTDTKITYICWANISAFDADYFRKTGEDKMIWLTEIQSEGKNDNLRAIFPYLMAAAQGYIGSTGNRVKVKILSNPVDKRVIEIKDALVTVIINQATTGRKYENLMATIYEDVYRNGELFIRAGTPVNITMFQTRYGSGLTNFSTTSVYGNNISLGRFDSGLTTTCYRSDRSLYCIRKGYRVKIPAGTLIYLEME